MQGKASLQTVFHNVLEEELLVEHQEQEFVPAIDDYVLLDFLKYSFYVDLQNLINYFFVKLLTKVQINKVLKIPMTEAKQKKKHI